MCEFARGRRLTSGCRSIGCLGWHWVGLRPKEQQLPKVSSSASDMWKYGTVRGQTEGIHLRYTHIPLATPAHGQAQHPRGGKLNAAPSVGATAVTCREWPELYRRPGRTLSHDSISTRGEAAALDFVGSSLGQLCGKQVQEK